MTVNNDIIGSDIGCFQDGSNADFCKVKCDNDATCKSYVYIHPNTAWGSKSGCCYKNQNTPIATTKGVDFYKLN
jgi:hypothetical protein